MRHRPDHARRLTRSGSGSGPAPSGRRPAARQLPLGLKRRRSSRDRALEAERPGGLVEDYLASCRSRGLSRNTIRHGYGYAVKSMSCSRGVGVNAPPAPVGPAAPPAIGFPPGGERRRHVSESISRRGGRTARLPRSTNASSGSGNRCRWLITNPLTLDASTPVRGRRKVAISTRRSSTLVGRGRFRDLGRDPQRSQPRLVRLCSREGQRRGTLLRLAHPRRSVRA